MVPVVVPLAVLPVVPLEVVPLVALGTFEPAVGGLLGKAGTAGTVRVVEVPGVALVVELTGGVTTTVDPVVLVIEPLIELPGVVPVVVPTAGALRAAPAPPGSRQVTSRLEQ